jgi:hypothetical protein
MHLKGHDIRAITLFYISLLFWGIFQGMGWVTGILWIQEKRIKMGGYCVAQGTPLVSFRVLDAR